MGTTKTTGHAMRKSTRVPFEVAVRVRSLQSGFAFDEECRTLVVNAQGCGFQCSREVPVGIAISLTIDNRQATATVLTATALGEKTGAWVVGARLHQAGNFWGLASPPADWGLPNSPAVSVSGNASDAEMARRTAGDIQLQCDRTLAELQQQVEKLLAAGEADFVTRVVTAAEAAFTESARRIGEQEAERFRQALSDVCHEFRVEIAEQSARGAAEAEQRLQQAQLRLAASAEAQFQATSQEIMQSMRVDANRLSESAIAQWHAAFDQTLQMLPELVRENLQRAGKPEPSSIHH